MCRHKRIEFIGIQKTYVYGRDLFLYNCLDCRTTIALEPKQARIRMNKDTSELLPIPKTAQEEKR